MSARRGTAAKTQNGLGGTMHEKASTQDRSPPLPEDFRGGGRCRCHIAAFRARRACAERQDQARLRDAADAARSPLSPRPTTSTSRASWKRPRAWSKSAAATFDARSGGQGQPVEPEPRRGSREGADRRRRGRPDARRLDAGDDQPGLDPVRDRADAEHLHHGAVAALVHRPAGRSGRRPARVEALRLHLPLFLGARGHHRGVPQHVEPARHQQGGRRPLPERRRRQRLGRSE